MEKKSKFYFESGFTLIEMLTSVFIFSILMVVFGGVFVTSLNLQRKAFNTQQVIENTSFILESMAKEIRTARIVTADNGIGCNAPALTSLSFTHPVNGDITYQLTGSSLRRIVNGTNTVLSSDSVEFTRLAFCVSGSSLNDNIQPRVTIIAGVRSKNTNQQASIDIQTTLSQRYLSD